MAKYISIEVILKYFDYLNNSDESLNELLNEWKIINSDEIINIYGFTNKNSLKRYLTEITKSWEQKLFYLFQIINKGLNDIHKKDLIHYNFHNDYIQASDIYSFSIIMWEFTSEIPPFNDKAHDLQLALSICKGERPEIIENTPQCYIDLMKKYWDEDSLKRPSSKEV
ncbi:kinase-like domain-containing protein [Rhizophagus irregularis DAOM 181602=DAOM 197198]|nr:kinase-like domain-containing protein [Rhizophagus irregularis DAOM 181602=DAOM 197198]